MAFAAVVPTARLTLATHGPGIRCDGGVITLRRAFFRPPSIPRKRLPMRGLVLVPLPQSHGDFSSLPVSIIPQQQAPHPPAENAICEKIPTGDGNR